MSIRFPGCCRTPAERSAWALHVAHKRWDRAHTDDLDKPIRTELPDLVRRITLEDFVSGRKVVFDLKRCSRIDQYCVDVDGHLWRDACGLSRVLAGIRKAWGRYGRH